MGSADEGVMPQQRSEELSHRVARRSFYIVIRSLAPRRPPGPTPRGRQILGRPIIASTRRKWLPTVGPFRAVRGLTDTPPAVDGRDEFCVFLFGFAWSLVSVS